MNVIRNRVDLALVSTAPTEIVDIGETGFDGADIVLEVAGGGACVIEGSDSEDGTWETALQVTVSAEGFERVRVPLDMPRFIRLGSGSAEGAKLSVRV